MKNIQDIPITELIPHREPMIIVSRLMHCTELTCKTEFDIKPDNIFVEHNILKPAGLIENIAQSAAAKIGYESYSSGDKPVIGHIGSIGSLQINNLPCINTTLSTTIEVTYQIMNATIVHGSIAYNDKLIAECNLYVFSLR